MGDIFKTFESPSEVSESMPCELLWSRLIDKHSVWVFWSKNNDELQRFRPSLFFAEICEDTGAKKEKIIHWLERVNLGNCLLQLWAPVTIGGKRFLTTADQPFALAELVKGLCSYRKHCLNYLFLGGDTWTDEALLGPPGRVFQNGLPEVSLDVQHYTRKEYPPYDFAVSYGVHGYLALPLFDPSGHNCIGVLELLCMRSFGFLPVFDRFASEVMGNVETYRGPQMAFHEIQRLLEVICRTHQLPFAQTWVPIDSNFLKKVRNAEKRAYFLDLEVREFAEACNICDMQKGQGVVGKAFLSKLACFCKDISQLDISEYSLVSCARRAGLTGCFAICLRHAGSGDSVFVVEFFIPLHKTGSDDPRTLIRKLLSTMKEQLQSFEVAFAQELEEKFLIEVIKTSSADELDTFEFCHLTGATSTPNRTALQRVEEIVPLPDGKENAEGDNVNCHELIVIDNVNSNEQNALSIVQHETSNELKNHQAIKRIRIDYGITLQELLLLSGRKLEDVASHFGVSRSTVKRICRQHGIYRWPPPKAKDDAHSNNTQKFVPHKSEILEGISAKELPMSDQQTFEQNLTFEPDTKKNATRIQDESAIAVKVTYRFDMIKFQLSLTSGKRDLEDEIAKRFNLSIGSFWVKYIDEDGDFILVTCDEDWKDCISALKPLGRKTVNLHIDLEQGIDFPKFRQ